MANKTKQEALLQALEKSLGVITTACRSSGISRSQFYEWMKDPEFKKRVDDIHDQTLDFAESRLHKLIADGNTAATIFFLKTKGKRRGYVESQEMTIHEPNKKPSWFGTDDEESA